MSYRKSPSRRRLSSIKKQSQEVDQLTITSQEIDEMIEKWNQVRHELRNLEAKEKRYKSLVSRIMELNNTNHIEGTNLEVFKKQYHRKFLSRENVPEEIFNEYAVDKEVSNLTIRERK